MFSSVRKDRTRLHADLPWKLPLPPWRINSFNYLCFLSCFQQLISTSLILYNKSTLHYPRAIWFLWSSVFSCVPQHQWRGKRYLHYFHKDTSIFSGLVLFLKNRDLWSLKFSELLVLPSYRRTWQWGTQSEVPLSEIICSRSLLWRKDWSLIFTAGVGRMVKEGNLLSSHVCWWSRVLISSGSMQSLFCSSVLALQSCLQLSWHPFSLSEMIQMEQKGMDGGTSGLTLARNGENVMKLRKESLRYMDRTKVSPNCPKLSVFQWREVKQQCSVFWCLS